MTVHLQGREGLFPDALEGFAAIEFLASLNIRCLVDDDEYQAMKAQFPDGYDSLMHYREPHVVRFPKRLYTAQDWINLRRVAHIQRHGSRDGWALTVQYHGNETIWDGHHRIVARRLLGLPVYVIGGWIDHPSQLAA